MTGPVLDQLIETGGHGVGREGEPLLQFEGRHATVGGGECVGVN